MIWLFLRVHVEHVEVFKLKGFNVPELFVDLVGGLCEPRRRLSGPRSISSLGRLNERQFSFILKNDGLVVLIFDDNRLVVLTHIIKELFTAGVEVIDSFEHRRFIFDRYLHMVFLLDVVPFVLVHQLLRVLAEVKGCRRILLLLLA